MIINDMPRINVMGWPAAAALSMTFKVFKFGFNPLHGPHRKVWYDDVAVAPTRVGCR